jgi:hypothetical protein
MEEIIYTKMVWSIPICSSNLNSCEKLLIAVNQFQYRTQNACNAMVFDDSANRIQASPNILWMGENINKSYQTEEIKFMLLLST